jgi:hypothetical protein
MIKKIIILLCFCFVAESADISISASKTKFSKGDNITVKCDFSLSSSEKLNYLTISVNNTEFYRFDYEDLSKHFGNVAKRFVSHEVFFLEVTTSRVLGSTETGAGLPGTAIIKNATELSEGVYWCEVSYTAGKQFTREDSAGLHISFEK